MERIGYLMKLEVEYDALTGLGDLMGAYKRETPVAAKLALNDVAEGEGLAVYRKGVEDQVDFGSGYLTTDRLGVRTRASEADLSVMISGRQRATSLARFARGQTPQSTRGKGVRVRVQKGGGEQNLPKAWLVRLRSGSGERNDYSNIGLAVRLKPGERLRNKREVRSVQLDQNVYLLYGPSVDQVFREVMVTDTPVVLEKISNEFFRQFFRLTKGARSGRR
jgi:hypothetical protein